MIELATEYRLTKYSIGCCKDCYKMFSFPKSQTPLIKYCLYCGKVLIDVEREIYKHEQTQKETGEQKISKH